MERKFYTDDFEQLLKEKSDEFRMYPSKRVWHSIYNDLHPGRKWPSFAVSMVLIIALFLTGYWNSNDNNPAKAVTIASADGSLQNNSGNKIAADNTMHQESVSASAVNNVTPATAQVSTNTQNHTVVSPAETKIANPKTNAVSNSNLSGTVIKNIYLKKFNKENNNTDVENKYLQQTRNSISQSAVNKKTIINAVENVNKNATDLASINSIEEITPAINNIITIETKAVNIANSNPSNENITASIKENKAPAITSSTSAKKTTILSAEDKAWIDDYALHNKSQRGRWKDRVAMEFYVTPGVGYRRLVSNSEKAANTANYIAQSSTQSNINNELNHKPGLGLEAGLGLVYAAAKNLRLKAGVQANVTNYVINADETNHPTLTTLLLNDLNTGFPYMVSRISTVANTSGLQPVKIHNKTYQISIPVGFAVKLSGNSKLDWYAGAAIQPTFVIGGKANLISTDKRNYVSDPSFIRHWNLNAGFETYMQYKFSGYTLQFGPQFRYQLVSTYSKQFSLNENLYNTGLKIGVLKNF